jgi:hypothetical protein
LLCLTPFPHFHVINYCTLAGTRGLIPHTTFGIGFEANWWQVEAMMRLAAERTPGLFKELAPLDGVN